MKFDLTTLSLFCAAYEQSSLAKAAESEHISLSALSKRISDLEHAIHGELFVRSHKGIEPTALAQDIIPSVRRILSELKQIEEITQEHRTLTSGFIGISATMAATRHYLPADLAVFALKYPGIRVELREDLSKNIALAVRSGAAQIGFLFDNTELEGLEYFPYRDDPLAVLVPRSHPLTNRSSIRFHELLEYELIAPMRGSMLEKLILSAFELHHREFRPKVRVAGFDSLCQMVREHLGIAIVPRQYLDARHNDDSDIGLVSLNETWATRKLWLCVKGLSGSTHAVKLFVDQVIRPDSPSSFVFS